MNVAHEVIDVWSWVMVRKLTAGKELASASVNLSVLPKSIRLGLHGNRIGNFMIFAILQYFTPIFYHPWLGLHGDFFQRVACSCGLQLSLNG